MTTNMRTHTTAKARSVGVANTELAWYEAQPECQQRMAQMSLYHYCRPADDVLDSKGPLSRTIAPSILAEVNKEVKSVTVAQKKKRGSYLSFTPEEKARVAQYGSVHGVRAAMRRFRGELSGELKETTVRDWVKTYKKELQNKRRSVGPGCDLVMSHLSGKKRGRPFLLGEKIDAEVQTIIRAMRDSGAVVNTSIAIAVAMTVVRKRDRSLLKEGGPLELKKNWAKSILHRMGFAKDEETPRLRLPLSNLRL